jgi:imidazolonepropionase-like amidohydrolase
MQADFVVWDAPSHTQIPYWLGASLARTVVKRGQVVYRAADTTRPPACAGGQG